MRYVQLLIIILIFLSCNQKMDKQDIYDGKLNIFTTWPDTINLSSTSVKAFDDYLEFPVSINATGQFLVFIENFDSAKVKIFSLDNYSYLSSYGRSGQGPNEFAAISAVIQDGAKDQPYLTFYDWGKKQITKYDINNLINYDLSEELYDKNYILPPEIIQTHQIFFSEKDSNLVGFAGLNRGKLFLYNTNRDSITKITPFIPTIGEGVDSNYDMGKLYRGSIAQNNIKKRIVVASRLFKQIEIYDYDLNLQFATRYGENDDIIIQKLEDRNEIRSSSDSRLNYTDLDFSSNRIYVYYENRTLQEMNDGVCTDSQIHSYDWEGNPKTLFKIEDCPNFIAYDHLNNRFLGVFTIRNQGDDEESILRYYQL